MRASNESTNSDAATRVPSSMTAWRQSRYGSAEVVEEACVAVPVPAKGEVLLRVRATSVNSGDVKVMRGEPLLIRPAFGLRRPRLATRGIDVAGTVVAVGAEVTALKVGDEVMGELAGGALAEYAVAPVARLTRRPDALAPRDAAALPVAGGTAWQALESAAVERGQRVLVIGAAGGVGHFAVQLAALRGAEVWAVCGARAEKLVADLGAVRTFDYRTTDAADLPDGSFDAVIDIAGAAPLRTLRRLVAPLGCTRPRLRRGGTSSRADRPHPPRHPALTHAWAEDPSARSSREARGRPRARRTRCGGQHPPFDRAHIRVRGGARGAGARRSRTHGRQGRRRNRVALPGIRLRHVREWMPACPSRHLQSAVPE